MWMVAVRLKPKNLGPTTQDSVTLYKWFSTRGTQFSKARAALSEDIFGLYNEGMGRGCCHAVRRHCSTGPPMHRTAPKQRIIQPNASTAPRMRNPALYWGQWAEHGEQGIYSPTYVFLRDSESRASVRGSARGGTTRKQCCQNWTLCWALNLLLFLLHHTVYQSRNQDKGEGFTTAKTLKQPKYPLADKYMVHTHNEILLSLKKEMTCHSQQHGWT